MAAKTRDELLALSLNEYLKLEALISDLPDDEAALKDDEDTSIKDVIGHRAHWIDLFLGWYEDGQAGKEVFFPAPGYKWNQLKAYNAQLRETQAGLSWDGVRDLLSINHARLVAFITEHDDADLYGGPMQGANNDWTPGRWAEAAGPSHYRSAAKYIRQTLKRRSG
ncbi:MAG: ClbS/DfsB family four-helix bundle protein [Hoeflea sp.]|uniref:ClbS/DfsB family four-helix bundle protein n=1 Tax=Hoeflea sp. TaxID=1940281 RepID=UPI0032EF608D